MPSSATPPDQFETSLKERFYRHFQLQIAALQDQISNLASSSAAEIGRTAAIEDCLAGISRLQTEVKDAAAYIPAYDQRTYAQNVKALGERLREVRSEVAPVKKFAFKSRKVGGAKGEEKSVPGERAGGSEGSMLRTEGQKQQHNATSTGKTGPAEYSTSNSTTAAPLDTASAFTISLTALHATHTIVPPSSLTSSAVLTTVSDSIVDLSASFHLPTSAPLTITLKDTSRSLILCGAVAGPIHITSVSDSVIVVACRQFRMHTSHNVDVYLWCGSRPIVEACTGVRVAPLGENTVTETIRKTPNRWSEIDDFGWLKAEQSPNWCVLPEAKRVREDVWQEISGKEGDGETELVLRRVGLSKGKGAEG